MFLCLLARVYCRVTSSHSRLVLRPLEMLVSGSNQPHNGLEAGPSMTPPPPTKCKKYDASILKTHYDIYFTLCFDLFSPWAGCPLSYSTVAPIPFFLLFYNSCQFCSALSVLTLFSVLVFTRPAWFFVLSRSHSRVANQALNLKKMLL